jgi:hypothetical protein
MQSRSLIFGVLILLTSIAQLSCFSVSPLVQEGGSS